MFSLYRYMRAVRLGVKNLTLHKARSALTMLGIIFGVSSVIAMLAIGEGASYEAQQAIIRLGSTNLIINAVKPPEDKEVSGTANSFALEYGLTYDDLKRLAGSIPGVARVLPMRRIRSEAAYSSRKAQCTVVGTLPIYPEILNETITMGRFFTMMEEARLDNVCVLSAGVARKLFTFQNPLEEAVKIDSNVFRVVGVIGDIRRGPLNRDRAPAGQSFEDEIFVPLATARALFGEVTTRRTAGSYSAERVELHRIVIRTTGVAAVESAARTVESMLTHFHDKHDYELTVPLRLLRQAEETKRIFNIVLGSIAAISLLVGGIGIMNIMLATVTERTREIGIRRALGAKKRDIVSQFLVETLVLSVGGGIIGVGLGLVIPLVVSHLTDIKTIVTPWSLFLAFGISALVGVVFGIYPASRAANLDPIEALRHD
jgi:putative ABC transport system permease protein